MAQNDFTEDKATLFGAGMVTVGVFGKTALITKGVGVVAATKAGVLAGGFICPPAAICCWALPGCRCLQGLQPAPGCCLASPGVICWPIPSWPGCWQWSVRRPAAVWPGWAGWCWPTSAATCWAPVGLWQPPAAVCGRRFRPV